MSVLRATFAAELRRIIEQRALTVTEAAATLQISRQALYNYLNEVSTPRARVLAKALELWNLEIRVGGQSFGPPAFDTPKATTSPTAEKRPKQLDLWQQLDSIKQDDLQIGVKRVGKTLRVSVQIGIPA